MRRELGTRLDISVTVSYSTRRRASPLRRSIFLCIQYVYARPRCPLLFPYSSSHSIPAPSCSHVTEARLGSSFLPSAEPQSPLSMPYSPGRLQPRCNHSSPDCCDPAVIIPPARRNLPELIAIRSLRRWRVRPTGRVYLAECAGFPN